MAYVRKKQEELTGYQAGSPFEKNVDFQCDFVMVYGADSTMPRRVAGYREQGYVVHLMTGISWGNYQDYLDGKWDGRSHWDESQERRDGTAIIHNPTVPYMVPTISFTNYLIARLKLAVDAGVEALHLEEPEFWDHGGYAPAFKREYEIYYKEPWQPPHASLDTRYKTSRLMAYLYARAVNRISSELKEYSMVQYGRSIPFYVPTHSLLNYTQWKIMSPEAALIDIPTVDGCIAQIWTGTSRTANVYEGVYRERTFETAYLEYGIMQELVRGTGRRMWFLHDPIEDRPAYRWEDYRHHYLKTVIASFLHPEIHRYEICPWPHRVVNGVYPRIQPNIARKDESSIPAPDAEPIPQSYASLLSGIFQLCGDMDQPEYAFEGSLEDVGIFMSDTGLYQRSFPDGIAQTGFAEQLRGSAIHNTDGTFEPDAAEITGLLQSTRTDSAKLFDFIQSGSFPQFYGMALPLLKYGLPVRPVQLDNISRFAGYLAPYKTLILSYEYIKPVSPDINASLSAWIHSGGQLIYIGDGSDPFHSISGFWKKAGFQNPAAHLLQLCGLPADTNTGTHTVGQGSITLLPLCPALICTGKDLADRYRDVVRQVLLARGAQWVYGNSLTLYRGPYLISAVLDESITDAPKTFQGLYADLLENDFKILTEKTVKPDEACLLFDLSKIPGENMRIVGTSARVLSLSATETGAALQLHTANNIHAFLRLRLPKPVAAATAADLENHPVNLNCTWDDISQTVLLDYQSTGETVCVNIAFI